MLKTFWTGWDDRQLPDGTVIWTTPSGKTYTTHPGSRNLFAHWNITTADLPPPPAAPPTTTDRGVMMPRRRRTRAAQRIKAERALNDTDIMKRNKPPPI